jgi:RNA recognition motif-containing protein
MVSLGWFDRPANSKVRPDFLAYSSAPTISPPSDQKRNFSMKNIFVGNLSFGATEESVRSLFETHGTVQRVNIVTDRDSGQARGFGFVEMTDDNEGEKAIAALNGRELGGRALNVNEARPKTDRGSGGGGNRSGGGGYGNRQSRW